MATFVILLIYLSGTRGGGPVTMEFVNMEACEKAALQIKTANGFYYQFHHCLSKQ